MEEDSAGHLQESDLMVVGYHFDNEDLGDADHSDRLLLEIEFRRSVLEYLQMSFVEGQ